LEYYWITFHSQFIRTDQTHYDESDFMDFADSGFRHFSHIRFQKLATGDASVLSLQIARIAA
jgi:hypothetical protein